MNVNVSFYKKKENFRKALHKIVSFFIYAWLCNEVASVRNPIKYGKFCVVKRTKMGWVFWRSIYNEFIYVNINASYVVFKCIWKSCLKIAP